MPAFPSSHAFNMNTKFNHQNMLGRLGVSVRFTSLVLIVASIAFCCAIVALRSLDIGTDTQAYANIFQNIEKYGIANTRLEPGYVAFAHIVSCLGFSIIGMQALTFLLLILTIVYSAREYWKYLGSFNSNRMFLATSLGLFFVSPMFVSASINAIRQGLASLLIFIALLFFSRRQWWKFIFLAAIATSFHYSSVIYFVFAPILLLKQRTIQIILVSFFLFYCLGLTEEFVKSISPLVYSQVMDYKYGSLYNAGVRIDFAAFSFFWYAITYVLAPLICKNVRDKIMVANSIYLTMLLPFFLVGFGNYSNRLLVPAWLSASLIIASCIYNCRIALLRHPVFLWIWLCVSCTVFYYFVTNEIIL